MSELITSIDLKYQGPGTRIIHAQDVEPVALDCLKRRQTNQQGREGLGVMVASIPVVEIEKAKHQGINLMKKDQREKWLKDHPQFRTYVEKGRTGKIIIK